MKLIKKPPGWAAVLMMLNVVGSLASIIGLILALVLLSKS
ncbi:MAG: hypothetical protein Pg6C_06140 [Treponemataceae bacterium]|nr:MAG: hypothetical protein Pg6C_06140 [Treponemataceae bacterium]